MKYIRIDLARVRGHIRHGQKRKLAEHLEISHPFLAKKLEGEACFTIDEINKVAGFLKLDLDEFIQIKKAA
ncbi:hypothetical protein IH992_32965 [Candidatus Poribacteria bacterium]|nr:hypothetical protein [Candidatus Poribacteria bacterium]